MLPRRYIERYLFFLLRHRWPVIALVALASLCFLYSALFLLTVFTNFFDLYPPGHPYIRLYAQYRQMFGTANVVLITLEVKDATSSRRLRRSARSIASRSICCTTFPE
jgi:predicted RND superfamily exporter protein